MHAAASGTVAIMQALVDAGADVNAKNSRSASALHWAVGDEAKVKLLLLHGATQAAVRELVQGGRGARVFFAARLFACRAALAQQLAIDTHLAKLVDDHGEAAALIVAEQMPQQRRLAAAEKSGDDRGR